MFTPFIQVGPIRLFAYSELLGRFAYETTPVGQTCLIALRTVEQEAKPCPCQYASKDPAFGLDATEEDVPMHVERILAGPLWERYVAMFTLRNVGSPTAVYGLCRALLEDTTSTLLRHEVAFVLGQMEDERATEALISSLGRETEHSMVRHEAAIALGSIGGEDVEQALMRWKEDADQLVAESCVVALATMQYWQEWDAIEARCSPG